MIEEANGGPPQMAPVLVLLLAPDGEGFMWQPVPNAPSLPNFVLSAATLQLLAHAQQVMAPKGPMVQPASGPLPRFLN